MSSALEKSVYVTDPTLESALCTQIFGRAVSAQMAMSALPWSGQELEQMSGFLSKVGDYASTLSRTVGGNGGCSPEELSNLTELAETASVMQLNLQDMQARMMAGRLTMGEVYDAPRKIGAEEEGAPLAGTVLRSMEAEFPELPTLIYDGPFSESMTKPKALFLEDLAETDEAAARSAAAGFLGVPEAEVAFQGSCGGPIPCRIFSAYMGGGEYTVYVTDRGGCVLSALCSRLPGSPKLSVSAALSEAEEFLQRQGIPDMAESYHMIENGVLIVNYEYEQNGVLCYPDLIKIGVALDNGSISCYDARGYLNCHYDRNLPDAEISEQEAAGTISSALTTEGHRLAVIPSPGGEERLCHEFVCRAEEDKHFVVYVNAITGAQEKILILLEDESGTLTI